MNPFLQRLMRQSASLDRSGKLRAATELIQKNLRDAAQWQPPPMPQPSAASTAEAGLAASNHAAAVIDVEARVLDDSSCRAASGGASETDTASARAHAERWSQSQFTHQGRTVAFRLYEPPQFTDAPVVAKSLVLMLHGCTQDAADFAAGTQMNALARSHGVLVLYPEQTAHANSQKCWNWFKPQHQQRGRGEPALLAALTRSVMTQHGIDASRVYVAGLSAGGAMADIVGRCYPDLFAAVCVHSGLPRGAAKDVVSALAAMRSGGARTAGDGTASPPVIVFHGDADSTVHPANAATIVDAALQDSEGQVGPAAVSQGASPQGRRFTRKIHRAVDGETTVEQWHLHGAGHAWAGGSAQGSYTDPRGINASAEMLRFFLENPRSK